MLVLGTYRFDEKLAHSTNILNRHLFHGIFHRKSVVATKITVVFTYCFKLKSTV